jgi:predicted ferric reductase
MTTEMDESSLTGLRTERWRSVAAALIWAALAAAVGVPVAAAAASPLLAWRGPLYIAAGFAGILALGLMLVQPLLAGGYLAGLSGFRGRRVHRWIGAALVAAIAIHVSGLWITSPPDMIDALTFTSPTPFSPFGVVAMWAILAVALLALFRRRLRLQTWRIAHMSLAAVIVAGSVVHAMLVEGPMETVSKAVLCALVLAAAVKVIADLRLWRQRATSRDTCP